MKKLISRVLTLVVIAGTVSNTTHCGFVKGQINEAAQKTRRLTGANTAVAAERDKGGSVEAISKKEEAAKKIADEARTWLDSVKELSTSTKLLLGTIGITGGLLGIDYGIARYTGERMRSAKALEAAQKVAEPYVENVREQASKAGRYVRESKAGQYVSGSRLNPWNWRKSAIETPVGMTTVPAANIGSDYYNDQSLAEGEPEKDDGPRVLH
jgi:hypothetical protein